MKNKVRNQIIALFIVSLLGILCGHYIAVEIGIPGFFITVFMLIPIEIVLEYYDFSGSCSSLLTLIIVFAGNYVSLMNQYTEVEIDGEAVSLMTVLVVSAYVVITFAGIIRRYFRHFLIRCLITLASVILEGVLIILLADYLYATFAALVVLALGLSVFKWKIREGEKLDEKYID